MSKIDIFISYKKEERAHADRYERALIDAGYAVVTDLKIEEGKDFGDVIDGMIRAARLVLVVWTHASAQSEWVRKEAIEADRLGKYFPIALEAITPEEIPLQLRAVHWQDLSSKSPEAAVEDTIARIGEKIGFRGRDDGDAAARSAIAEGDLAFFQIVNTIGEAAGYREYLQRYPGGVYAGTAKQHLGWPAQLRRKLPDAAWIIALTAIASIALNHWSTPPDIQEAAAKAKMEVTKTLTAQHDRALKDTEKSHESAIAELKAHHAKALQAQAKAIEIEKVTAVEAVQALETAKKAHESAIAELKASHAQALQAQAKAVAAARREVSTSSPAPSTLTGDARAAYDLASKRIAQAQREGWKFLNLSGDETDYTFAGETRTGDTRLKALTMIPPEIEGLNALQRLDLDETQVADISALKGLTALQRLWLYDTQVADISALKGLTALQWLSLGNTQVADISALKGLTALQWLWLYDTQVSDINALKGLTALQELYLYNTQVADINALKRLTALEQLSLRKTQVADISALKGLAALQRLWLYNTQVADISALKGLTALQELYLYNTQVADISALKGLTALEQLGLSNTQVADISALKRLTALEQLDLNNTQVADISALKGLTALQKLWLQDTEVTDLSPLQSLNKLSWFAPPRGKAAENRAAVVKLIADWRP